jgi:hypothetical protein
MNSKEYYIQILDGTSNQITYFDRTKIYRSTQRVITSPTPVKTYLTKQAAESDAEQIEKYYHGEYLIEVVERELTGQDIEDWEF